MKDRFVSIIFDSAKLIHAFISITPFLIIPSMRKCKKNFDLVEK